jgi:hypothetical protein
MYVCHAWMNDVCFSYSYVVFGKNRSFRFYKPDVFVLVVLLTKLDGPICQIELSDFDRHNICFSCFNCCDSLVMCITYYLFTHTIVAPLGCVHVGGALLDFLKKCTKWYLWAKFEFHSICKYLWGANSICMDSKYLLNIFCKL